MNWPRFFKAFAVQFIGQGILGSIAWYWLSLGVASVWLVAWNVVLALLLLIGWSLLDAYGLGAPRNWLRALPAVALTPLMGVHVGFAILIPFLWLILLFPSVAAGRWKISIAPPYIAISVAIVLGMILVPAALLTWIPSLQGLNPQLASFALRAGLAYSVFVAGWAGLLQFIGDTISRSDEGLLTS